jgi:hypothetical protein
MDGDDTKVKDTSFVVFDDTPVIAKSRATMPLWNTKKPRTDEKIYSKNRIPTYGLPTKHKYEKSNEAWKTKAQLITELDKRVLDGTQEKFNKAKSRIHLEYLLLLCDGEDVSLTYSDPPRTSVALGAGHEMGDGDDGDFKEKPEE